MLKNWLKIVSIHLHTSIDGHNVQLSLGWHGQGVPEYDEGLNRVQGDEWRNCGEGSV